MKNIDFKGIRELLVPSGKIVITSHHNPDGDAIGACLAMFHFLQPMVDNICVIVPNDYPGFLKWLPGSEEILVYNRNVEKARQLLQDAKLIFCLDYNSIHRTEEMADSIGNSPARRCLIDHHPEPVLAEFDFHFSLVETSSTCELVYRFIREISLNLPVSKAVAENLFVGIMTDTGSFSYSCNYPETFLIAAELIRAGVDAEHAHRLVFDTYSELRLRLLGYSLSEKMTILPEYRAAYITLSKEELDRFNYQVGDTEGVVNYALSTEGVVIAVLLTQRKDRIRLSFRSKGTFPVNKIARDHFGGGGHFNAAGGDSFENLDDTVKKLKMILEQYKEEINRSIF